MNGVDMDVVAAIANEVAAQVGELRFNLWFRDNARLTLFENELMVGVPNLFFQEWLNSNFMGPLRKATELVVGRRVPVRVVVDGDLFRAMRSREESDRNRPASTPPVAAEPAAVSARRSNARDDQTLETFVVGPSNRMAHASALRIAEEPAARFNPLIFYGPLGLGKTHLLRGILYAVRQRHRHTNVVYMTAEAFTNAFLEDMRAGRLAQFRQRVRGCDLLLIDDIQFMAAKRATQNELLHTYEAFDAAGKQMVLAVDQHPRMMRDVCEQLLSRLVAGMACPIESPDFDTRLTILEQRGRQVGLRLNQDVLEYVATHFRTNVRELEGALHGLKAHADVTGEPVDLGAAQKVLADLIRHSTKTVTLKEIELAICETFEIKTDQLRSPDRSRAVSQPRMLAMYLARKYTGAAYDAIGDHFGGRNHSTVMFAERKVQTWLDESVTLSLAGRPWRIVDAIRAVEQQLK